LAVIGVVVGATLHAALATDAPWWRRPLP
jgi:hypothetical protein